MTRNQRRVYRALLVLAAGALVAFLGWWFTPAHVPRNFHGPAHAWDWLLFVALTLVFGHRIFMDVLTWVIAWGIRNEHNPGPPAPGLKVGFLTTFVPSSEPLDLLRRTLPAMLAVDYPHDTWLLDEGNVQEVRRLCEGLGVRYFSRAGLRKYNLVAGPFTAKTKGGNHNAWYDSHGHEYDIVAQLDTDFAPRPDFLTRTLGHFADERVGFVGTPQVYGNTSESFVARGAAQQLYVFYGALMRGLASRGHANMIGANHVVRVSALREVGLYAGHLTEDLLTGMRLHANGWQSRYVSEPLAIGEGPSTWQSYFNQQMRWAFGCMDILRWHSPKLLRRMPRGQGLLYLCLQQHYFAGLASALGMGLLVNYFASGVTPANVRMLDMLVWVTPLVLARQGVTMWLARFNRDPGRARGLLLSGRYTAAVSWPVYLLAAVGVFRQRRLVFKVTPKGPGQPDGTPWSVALPHLVAGLSCAACLASAAVTGRNSLPMLFWATVNGLLMLSFVGLVALTRLRGARVTAGSLSIPGARRYTPSTVLVHPYIVHDHLLRPGRAV